MAIYPAKNTQEASELLIDVSNQLHEIVNEDAASEISTDSGLIPSVRKALADTFLFQQPIPWDQGQTETAFNQLRTFGSNLYWAPSATLDNPISMGATPEGDPNWPLAPTRIDKSSILIGLGKINKGFWDENPTLSNSDEFVVYRNTGDCFGAITTPYTVDSSSHPNPEDLLGVELFDISYFATKNDINEAISAKNLSVTPEDFGAKQGVDSTTEVIAWLKSGKPLHLDKSYIISTIDEAISDIVTVPSTGELVSSENSAGAPIVKITGSNNKLKNGFNVRHTSDMRKFLSLIWLEGTKNRVEGCDTSCDVKYLPSEGEQYVKAGIVVIGDSNSAVGNSGKNVGTGIIENGRYSWIEGNNYKVICAGYKMQSKSRYAQILGNIAEGEPSVNLQGCDGIFGERSHRFSVISGNTIKNFGEHGAYLQGDGFTLDKSNRFEGCAKCGVKIGSKTDGNFAYPGETLPQFDQTGAAVTTGGQYASTGAKVFPVIEGCNTSNSTDGAFCMQTNIADIQVLGFDIRNCGDGSVSSIRSLYLEGEPEASNWVMANIHIGDNGIVRASGDIQLACSNGLKVGKIDAGVASIQTYAKNGGTNLEPLISVKTANIITLDRSTKPRVEGGKVVAVVEGTASDAELVNVTITDQSKGGNWDTGRIRRVEGGEVNWLGTDVFNINSVNAMESVEIIIPNCTASYALQYNFNGANPSEGQFSDNIANCPLSNRPVRIGGNVSCANSNTIIGKDTADFSLTIEGDGVSAVGNTANAGRLRLNPASSNCNINHPKVSASGDNHTIYGDDIRLEKNKDIEADKATNCFAVGRTVTDNNPGGGNKKLVPA